MIITYIWIKKNGTLKGYEVKFSTDDTIDEVIYSAMIAAKFNGLERSQSKLRINMLERIKADLEKIAKEKNLGEVGLRKNAIWLTADFINIANQI